MFIITKEEFVSLVWPLREKEKETKGKINRELFIFSLDASGKIINKLYWKEYKTSLLERVVFSAVSKPRVESIFVSTEYFDWKIIVYKK